MIDWDVRKVALFKDAPKVTVDREMQIRGLRPHEMLAKFDSDSASMGISAYGPPRSAVGTGLLSRRRRTQWRRFQAPDRFSPEEAAIRDCYDSFLNGLERFASYAYTKLVTIEDLKPYIGYWIDAIAAPSADPIDAAWSASFVTYVNFYKFANVVELFKQFGKDINPDSPLFASFLRKMTDKQMAMDLAKMIRSKYAIRQEV